MDLVRKFKEAVLRDDALGLRDLFVQYPLLKTRIDDPLFSFDTPAIVQAAARKQRGVIETLLDLGADINARSKWWAGSFGVLDNDHHDLVPWLIDRGAKLDAHAAARHFMLDELHEIVKADPALVNAPGGDGQTPLHVASTVEIATFLLDHGAVIDALDVDHESTPAQYLISSRPEVMRYLVQRGCRTDILLEAAVDEVDLLRKHLDADPESIHTQVNQQYFPMANPRAGGTIYFWTIGKNRTAHQVAASFGNQAALELLFERTPDDLKLAQACLTGNFPVVHTMLARGPAKVRDLIAANPHYISNAAEDNASGAVQLMLEAGWPIEGDGKQTPLHWACWHGNRDMALAILAHQPPLELRDAIFNATPLRWAIHGSENSPRKADGDYAGIVEALLKAGAKRPEKIEGSQAVRKALDA